MKKQIYLFFTLLLMLPTALSAQQGSESDFQFRTGFTIDKKLVDKLHIAWSEELRIKNNASDVDRIYSMIGVSYQLLPWLEAEIDYTFIAVSQPVGWEYRNRSNMELTASYKWGSRWRFSLRERFRITSANKSFDPQIEANPSWIMRTRAMAEYSFERPALRPYAYFELSNTLNMPSVVGNYIDKIRFSLGVKYALSPRSEFDLFYRLDHNRSRELTSLISATDLLTTIEKQNNHIVGIFYKYSF